MTAKTIAKLTAKQELAGFLAKFDPSIAAKAKAVIAQMRKAAPGAVELVYDNYNALAIGFGPSEKTSQAVLSVAVWPRSVMLYFLNGASLKDPDKLLKGSGSRGRHIPDVDAASFMRPEVMAIIAAALKSCEPPIDPAAKATTVIKSVSAKQRPRRPAAKVKPSRPATKAKKSGRPKAT